MRGVRDRAGEIKRLLALLGDDRRGNGNIVLAGTDAGQNASPGQDFLFDLERREFAQIFDQFVIETGRLSVLDEFERTKIFFRRNDETALLDFIEAGGLCMADQHRDGEQRGQKAGHQTS